MPNQHTRTGVALLVDLRSDGTADSLRHLPGPDVYSIHLGAGTPPARQAADELRVNVPGHLLERLHLLVEAAHGHHLEGGW